MEICEAHWERACTRVVAFRLGLCAACFAGKPTHPGEAYRDERNTEKLSARRASYYARNRERIAARMRAYRECNAHDS